MKTQAATWARLFGRSLLLLLMVGFLAQACSNSYPKKKKRRYKSLPCPVKDC